MMVGIYIDNADLSSVSPRQWTNPALAIPLGAPYRQVMPVFHQLDGGWLGI